MGKLEKKNLQNIRKTKINTAIIGTLAIAGGLTITVMAPNVLGALGRLSAKNRSQQIQGMNRSLLRLIERGYIRTSGSGNHQKVELTEKGEQFAAHIVDGKLIPSKPKRWDGKWRILIFDIPERKRRVRDQTRITLLGIGFYRLQDSVWVYPYDCEDFILLFKTDFDINKELIYIIADYIEDDRRLCKYFQISKKT